MILLKKNLNLYKNLTIATICIIQFTIVGCDQSIPKKIVVQNLVTSSKSWNGNDLPNYPKGKPEIKILKITIPPKTKLNLHKHPTINAGVLTKGNLMVVSEDNDTLRLKAGNPIIEIVNKWHFGINNGEIPAEIIVFYAGTKGQPITITK